METTIFILAALAISIVWVVIKRMIYAGAYKGVNAAENAVKRKEEKELREKAKAKALTDPEFFQKNRRLFTTEEIESVTKRYKAESDLASSINSLREQRYKKAERGKNYVNLAVSYGTNFIGAYNNIAKVYNAFAEEDKKRWPIIGDKQQQQNQQKQEDQKKK